MYKAEKPRRVFRKQSGAGEKVGAEGVEMGCWQQNMARLLVYFRRDISSRENRGNRETASGRKWKSRLRWVGLGAAAAGGTGGGAELPAR